MPKNLIKISTYIASPIMTQGEQYECSVLEDIVRTVNTRLENVGVEFDFYSPRLNASINDKSAMTVEQNNSLAEKIVKADCERLYNADVVIFNLSAPHNALGTVCELGAVHGFNSAQGLGGKKQQFFCVADDIRRQFLPERGDRRSWSINQFLYGVVLDLTNGEGLMEFDMLAAALEIYGRKLADQVAISKQMVCEDAPVDDSLQTIRETVYIEKNNDDRGRTGCCARSDSYHTKSGPKKL